MIEVVLNDRLGKKVRVKCNEDDTIGDLKKLAAAQLGPRSVNNGRINRPVNHILHQLSDVSL